MRLRLGILFHGTGPSQTNPCSRFFGPIHCFAALCYCQHSDTIRVSQKEKRGRLKTVKRKPEDKNAVLGHEPTLKAIAKAADKNPECIRNTVSQLAKDLGIKIRRTRHQRR